MARLDSDIKVSVLIPHYNRSVQFRRSAMLLAEQTYRNFEVVLVDDGSDGFHDPEYPNNLFLRDLQVHRLRAPLSPPRSPNMAWNHAYSMAKGDFIITMHPEIMVPLDGIEQMLLQHERPYRSVACQYVVATEAQYNRLDMLPWLESLNSIKQLPDFWSAQGPWLYDNLSAPRYRSHLSFSGNYREDWEYIAESAGVPFLPEVEDPDFLSDDTWLHQHELTIGRPSRGVEVEVYHQWHERIYRADRPQYSARVRRLMDADRDAARDWKPS